MKPIILISILNKYLDIPIYLDNRTPLLAVMIENPRTHPFPTRENE